MANVGIIPYAEKGDVGNKKPEDVSKCKIVTRGDFVINSMNYGIGSYGWSDYDGVCSPVYIVLKPQNDIVESRFAFRIFENRAFQTFAQSLGNGILEHRCAINWDILKPIGVGVPPMDEQKAILDILDRETGKIDELVAEQRRLMDLLKEKRQAVISHAVTRGLNPAAPLKPSGIEWLGDVPAHWAVKPLKYLMSLTSGGTPSKENLAYWDGTVPWASSKDLKTAELFDTQDHITQKALDDGAADLVPPGSILTVVRGMILLHTFPVVVARVPMAINQDLKAILPTAGVNPDFLAWLLRGSSAEVLSRTDEAGHGTKVLRLESWLAMQVPVPPPEEQTLILATIIERLAELDTLTAEAQRAVDLLQERRTALISAAVTGQIDVRGLATGAQRLAEKLEATMARAVLAAEILTRCAPFRQVRKVRLQKLIHLSEYEGELAEIQGDYERQALGPYDDELMDEVVDELLARRWYEQKKEGDHFIYVPLEKAGEHTAYLSHRGDKFLRVQRVLDLLKSFATNRCERYSTLYAAWNDLLLKGRTPTDDEIIHEASDPQSWHERKGDFAPESWVEALQWMKVNGVIPKGFGVHTRNFRAPRRTFDRSGAQMELL
jgi:type I restriction enzyme S subunit